MRFDLAEAALGVLLLAVIALVATLGVVVLG